LITRSPQITAYNLRIDFTLSDIGLGIEGPERMQDLKWWQHGVIYQIYPRSFQDSNGDGIGDLPGIIRRLDHVVSLGIDAIWLSPIYPSPMADFGYDVTDYCNVARVFGNLADFDRLVAEAHRRGLRLILDFVPNHTSNEHPWFIESRSSRANPKRDWYVWRDAGPEGALPNNWLSRFGGPAWEWDGRTNQYYYHSFLKEQPDVNWRNPTVKQAMYDVLRFWLDRGVDGFRVDVLWLLIKDDQFRDNPVNPGYAPGESSHRRLLPLYTANRPEVHAIVAEMRSVTDTYPDRVLIGEIYLPIEQLVTYYGHDLKGAHLPFNFQLLQTAWNAASIAQIIQEYEAALPHGAWPNWVLGNHDKERIASKIGSAQARVAAMLLLTLRGTPTIYYGEEIGMKDVPITPEQVQDPAERNEPGLGLGRDPERTPMPWDGSHLAGFTSGQPWLPLGADHVRVNVEGLRESGQSILNLYRRLIDLRRDKPVLTHGSIDAVTVQGNTLRYERRQGNQRLVIALNLAHERAQVSLPSGRLLLSTDLDCAGEDVAASGSLGADEGIIIQGT
jgi:alpha-glucosidase